MSKNDKSINTKFINEAKEFEKRWNSHSNKDYWKYAGVPAYTSVMPAQSIATTQASSGPVSLEASNVQNTSSLEPLNGLVAFYISTSHASAVDPYQQRTVRSFAALADAYLDAGYYPIWFKFAGKRASHMELWPFGDNGYKQEVRLYIERKSRAKQTVTDNFVLTRFLTEFDAQHPDLLATLGKQGIKFRCDFGSQTKIVLY